MVLNILLLMNIRLLVRKCLLGLTGAVSKQLVTPVPIGGMTITLVGDIAQVLHHSKPKSDLAMEGYCMYMYKKFEKVVKFEVNERARDANDEQQRFRALQTRARDGNSNLEDWNTLSLRQPRNVVDINNFQNSAVTLSFGNEKVAKDNYERLKKTPPNNCTN